MSGYQEYQDLNAAQSAYRMTGIRQFRGTQKLSQEELAYKAGVHRTYLGGIERGERNPSLKNLAAIAKALNVRLADLVDINLK